MVRLLAIGQGMLVLKTILLPPLMEDEIDEKTMGAGADTVTVIGVGFPAVLTVPLTVPSANTLLVFAVGITV